MKVKMAPPVYILQHAYIVYRLFFSSVGASQVTIYAFAYIYSC